MKENFNIKNHDNARKVFLGALRAHPQRKLTNSIENFVWHRKISILIRTTLSDNCDLNLLIRSLKVLMFDMKCTTVLANKASNPTHV